MYIHQCMTDEMYIKITVDRVSNYKSVANLYFRTVNVIKFAMIPFIQRGRKGREIIIIDSL